MVSASMKIYHAFRYRYINFTVVYEVCFTCVHTSQGSIFTRKK